MTRQFSQHAALRTMRARRRQRTGQRGQTLVVFALSITILLGLAGLAIDVLRAYDLYAHEQRAAEAGALAGVIYMPNFYSYSNPATAIDNNSAVSRAHLEVQKNGFGLGTTSNPDCDTGKPITAEVAVCQDTAVSGTALQVTITEPISVFLLSVVGVQDFSVSATAGADYLDVNVLGSNPGPGDTNTWGDGGRSNPKFFNPSISGPGEFKEMGDPYVYCEDGSSIGPPANGNMANPLVTTPLQHTVGGATTIAGFVTNHLPYPPLTGSLCGSANPDKQPPGFTGEKTKGDLLHPGAYNFAILGQQNDAIWIYNAPFAANDPQSSCNGAQVLDAFMQDNSCSTYYTTYGPLTAFPTATNPYFDDPRLHFDVTYSLYRAQSRFSRSADQLIASWTYHPMDQIRLDLSAHNCATNGSESYDLSDHSTYTVKANPGLAIGNRVGCVTPNSSSTCPSNNLKNQDAPATAPYTWVCIGTLPFSDTYRLAVEATPLASNGNNDTCPAYTCGWGRHTYAIADCAPGSLPGSQPCTGNGKISGWNNFDLYMNFPSATKNNIYVPIANIPATYAGRSVILRLFNPGPTHGFGDDAYFSIVPPDPCIAIHYALTNPSDPTSTWARLTTYPGTLFPALTGACPQDKTALYASAVNPPGNGPSDEIYKGLWVTVTFDLPSTFTGGQFWLDNFSAKGKNFNQVAVSATLAGGSGSPVHLIF